MTTRIVELRRGILKKNDELAAGLRGRYGAAGVLVLNLVSSPGTGKTAFLERTLRDLRAQGSRVAALVGDLETDNDARRLAASALNSQRIRRHRSRVLERKRAPCDWRVAKIQGYRAQKPDALGGRRSLYASNAATKTGSTSASRR